jgi:hypothetical protein
MMAKATKAKKAQRSAFSGTGHTLDGTGVPAKKSKVAVEESKNVGY